jgi:CubicO group peptidase (beta-lactamase class C family)
VFAIGSITKSYTALATLQLVDAGKLTLNDTVGQLLPDYQGPARDVALRHLLDHTSGIPNYTDIAAIRPQLERNAWSRAQLVGTFAPLPLAFEPGTRWDYSNSNYYLLGQIIEKVSGLDYYEYLDRNVFAPLGLQHTFGGNDADIVAGRARGYRGTAGGLANASPWYYLVPFSAGSLLATAEDVARYRRGVFRSAAISPSLRDLVTRTLPLQDGTPNMSALGGLVSSNFQGHRKFSHSGEIYGFHSNHAYYPDDDLTIVVLANRKGLMPSPVSLEHRLARIVLGLPSPPTRPVPMSAQELARYTGHYELRPFLFGGDRYVLAIENGMLAVKFGDPSEPGLPFLPVAPGRFVCALDDEWVIEFTPGRRGAPPAGFRMMVADGTIMAYRSAP